MLHLIICNLFRSRNTRSVDSFFYSYKVQYLGVKMAKAEASVDGSKKFVCTMPRCGQAFDSEEELMKHLGFTHKLYARGGMNILKEGTELDDGEVSEINSEGYRVPAEKKPIDMMNMLRRILTNNGVRDRRESIVELFEYEDIGDLDALKQILAMAEVSPRKQEMIVSLWAKNIAQLEGKKVDNTIGPDAVKRKLEKNPMDIKPGETMDWSANDWGTYMMQMRKYMDAQQMQQTMLKQMMQGYGGDDRPSARIPPEVQAQLDRLKAYEEQEKLNKVIEPLIKEIRYMRAEQDEKKAPKSPFEDLVEMAKMRQMMESLNSKEGAEFMRLQMEERLEKLRIEQQREIRDAQIKQEGLKNENQVLQLRAMEAAFGAKLDTLKTQLDVANTTKKDDLLTTLKQAQEITAAMKGLTGDQESPEDKKMKAISEIIQSAAETLKPVAAAMADGMMNKRAGGAPPGYAPPPQYGPPMGGRQAPGRVSMSCPNCNNVMSVDPTASHCECGQCHTEYNIQPAVPASPPPMPSLGSNPGNSEARRQALIKLPDQELAAAAIQLNLNPSLYTNKEQLVDDMLRARGL